MPSLDFNELDSLFGHTQPASQAAVIVAVPAMSNKAEIKDIPLVDLPDIPEPQAGTEISFPELPNLIPNTTNEPKDEVIEIPLFPKLEKTPTRVQPPLQEKQKSKWLSVSFLSILLAAIVIALFLWLNRAPKNPQPEPANEHPASQTRQKTPEQQAIKKELIPGQTLTSPAVNARQAFASGKFNTAGDLWRQELVAEKISFSILLEMDCIEQSVRSAYQQITDKENFFILNRVKDGRSCWLVIWGKFRSQNEALQNLKLLPEYFFKQSEPPVVIELNQYL